MAEIESYKIPEIFDDTTYLEKLDPQVDYALASWAPGVYQIECDDLILGYNSSDGSDGVSNNQAHALANRTRYLLELFLKDHNSDGTHNLTNDDFADNISIPERKIHMGYKTKYLEQLLTDLQKELDALTNTAKSIADNENMDITWAIAKVIPIAWKYTGDNYAFELFCDDITLGNTKSYSVLEAHKLDDTITLDTKEEISIGDSYILSINNGEDYKVVTVRDTCPTTDPALHPTDIRLTEDVGYLIEKGTEHPGYLSNTNVPSSTLCINTTGTKFAYISNVIGDTFKFNKNIYLHVVHTKLNDDVVKNVQLNIVGTDIWTSLRLYSVNVKHDGTTIDTFMLPDNIVNFKVLIEYYNMTVSATYNTIAILSKTLYEYAEYIKRPSINSTTYRINTDNTRTFTVNCSEYLSVYDMPQSKIEIQASVYSNFNLIAASTTRNNTNEYVAITTINITLPSTQNYFLRMRYIDSEGTTSSWSPCILV